MTKTELLNKFAQDADQRLMLARVMDKLETTRQRNLTTWTSFLTLSDQQAAQQLIAACGHPEHRFFGGFDGAERQICVFFPDWQDPDDWLSGEDCPLRGVALHHPEGLSLSHRDFLGSILGLGITREKVGDLLVGDAACQVVLLEEVESTLLTQLEQVGRQKVKVRPLAIADLVVPQQETKAIKDTVATLRLDAVASSGFSTSRAKMAALISSKKVMLNGRECDKTDRIVAEGDVLVCRGLGKCRLKEVGGTSKKGRTMIVIERYI